MIRNTKHKPSQAPQAPIRTPLFIRFSSAFHCFLLRNYVLSFFKSASQHTHMFYVLFHQPCRRVPATAPPLVSRHSPLVCPRFQPMHGARVVKRRGICLPSTQRLLRPCCLLPNLSLYLLSFWDATSTSSCSISLRQASSRTQKQTGRRIA